MKTAALTGLVLAGLVMTGPGMQVVAAQDAANTPAFYTAKVRPIFQTSCGTCHMGTSRRGGLSLETKAATMRGGRDGVVIVPGDPAASLLVKLIRHEGPADDPMPMPEHAAKLSDADIAVVEQWVKAGAVMPDDPPPAQ